MAERILSITSRLTRVAELVMDIDIARLPDDEIAVLEERLPAWSLTLSAISTSIAALEETLGDERLSDRESADQNLG